jgi:hypothetical protein
MIKSVGGAINGEEPAWVKEYNALGELRRKEIEIERLKKLIDKGKKPLKGSDLREKFKTNFIVK